MALTKCQECGMLFDSTLIHCPSCGHDATVKKNRVIDIIGYTVSGLAIAAFILWLIFPPSNNPPSVKTDAEIRQEKIESQFSSWDGSHRKLTELIKENMHNPDSFKHVRTYRYDKSKYSNQDLIHVRTIYRGTNLFNAVVTNTIEADVDIDGNIIEITRQE